MPFLARMRRLFFTRPGISANKPGSANGFRMFAGEEREFAVSEGLRAPAPPKDLQVEGRKLWRDVVAEFEPNAAELALLYQLCLTVDELAEMKAEMAEMGVVVAGSRGQPRVNPVLSAIAAHRRLVDQLVVALGVPLEGEVVGRRRSAAAKQSADAKWRRSGPRRKGRLASVQGGVQQQEKE